MRYKRIPRPRPSLKHRYRPQRVNLRELRREPKSVPPRVVYVQNEQADGMWFKDGRGPTELPMSSGSRPRDTGHLWNSQIGFQEDRSLL